MMKIQTSQGEVVIDVPDEFDRVAVKLSGGADSSLLMYLLSLYSVRVRKLDLFAVTVINSVKPYQHIHANRVIEFIEKNLGVKIKHLVKPDPVDPNYYSEEQNNYLKSFRSSGVFQINFSGITENPDVDLDPAKKFTYATERDKSVGVKPVRDRFGFTPFANVNKKAIAEMYETHGLMDSLFPLTRSCENKSVLAGEPHCGDGCWWCLERKWGFGRLQ